MEKEETILEGVEEKEEKKKKTKAKKSKVDFSVDELKEKIYLLFDGITKILKYDNIYEASDFEQEAKGLLRICEKFPFVADVIKMIDPILVIFGLINKFSKLKKKEDRKQAGGEVNNVGGV